MTRSSRRQAPACYQVRVDGHLDDHWSSWFADLVVVRESDRTTSITGAVRDQAELHGLLAKVRDLGVALVSVAVVDPPAAPAAPAAPAVTSGSRPAPTSC